MIRFPIPFSMEKLSRVDPQTFDPIYIHPFVNIGSSYSSLKPEIREWMLQTFGKCDFKMDNGNYCLFFDKEEDLTLFLLRWS